MKGRIPKVSNIRSEKVLVLKWDVIREEKGKHGKFDNLWKGPYLISDVKTNNTFSLDEMDG